METYPITTAMILFLIRGNRILLKKHKGKIGGFYFPSNGQIDIKDMLCSYMEGEQIYIEKSLLRHLGPISIGDKTVFTYKCHNFAEFDDEFEDHQWFDFVDIPYRDLNQLDAAVILHIIRDEVLPHQLPDHSRTYAA